MIRTKTDDTWTRREVGRGRLVGETLLLRDDTWTRQGPANQSS